jgi:hypothetical protein
MGNRFGNTSRRPKGIFGVILPVGILLVILVLFSIGINYLVQANEQEALDSARNAIMRSTTHFYAVEGFYPPNISVLVEHYGLLLDEERFIFHYNAFASNIMPHIVVLPRE